MAEPQPGAVLPREALMELLAADPPLVAGLRDVVAQVQPNGIDLSVAEVLGFTVAGEIGREDRDRRIAGRAPLPFAEDGWLRLAVGAYVVVFNEVVHLPRDVMAFGRSRSSLLRCGAALHTAVWDAGYEGRSESLLVVHHPGGLRLAQGARLLQLVFLRLSQAVVDGYRGVYQGERLVQGD